MTFSILPRRYHLPVLWAVASLGCGSEFSESTPRIVSVELSSVWPDTMAMLDVDTVTLQLTAAGAEVVAGIPITWASSDSGVVQITPLPSTPPGAKGDPVALRAQLTAVGRGTAEVRASISGAEVLPDSLNRSVTVRQRWSLVAVGHTMSCAIAVDQTAFCWGTGYLGDGSGGGTRPAQVVLPTGTRATEITVYRSACLLSHTGAPYCWGQNGYGEVGNGSLLAQVAPAPVLGGATSDAVSIGIAATCLVTRLGPTLCWGWQDIGLLGNVIQSPQPAVGCQNNTMGCRLAPDVTYGFLQTGDYRNGPLTALSLASVSMGWEHACGLTANGTAYCWGSLDVGALGVGPTNLACLRATDTLPCSPIALPVITSLRFERVVANPGYRGFSCGITLQKAAHCWGAGDLGQLGRAPSQSCVYHGIAATFIIGCDSLPVPVGSTAQFRKLALGNDFACGLTTGGQALCWGENTELSLGATTASTCASALEGGTAWTFPCARTPVQAAGGMLFSDLAAGVARVCGVAAIDGGIYCWGFDPLSTGSLLSTAQPQRLPEPL